ncbi:MAG: hypothetical protein JRJ37_00895 [Deltaproteobacteria bacterium]|nr:hypothetical protein [Deltaproteobacteria bacterium]MBW2328015.1 hypothetical protein [Deltaproteobacteria bacterium]
MLRYRKTGFTLVGILIGVVIVHPYAMLVNRFNGSGHTVGSSGDYVATDFLAIFTPAMLPMTIAFGFFSGVCGLLLCLLFERNQRILYYQYQARLHCDLMNALHQLLGVLSHYILNSSMLISGHARRLQKKAKEKELQSLNVIAFQAEKNEEILKLMQNADFLENIDPSDNTYQKLVDLSRRIEEHFD